MTPAEIYQAITDKMIKALEQGNVPWRKPWTGSSTPMSMSTKKPYGLTNSVLLWAEGFESAWWGTYKGIQKLGGQIKRGEKGTYIIFWKQVVKKETDPQTGQEKTSSFPMLRAYSVFNADQANWEDGKRPGEIKNPLEFSPIEEAEKLVQEYLQGQKGLTFQEKEPRAYYRPKSDLVNMPRRETFKSVEDWYSTFFHELVHSTGHSSRLSRPGILDNHSFGDAEYSQEELVAEMGASFLCALAGLDTSRVWDNSVGYVQGWLRALKQDKKLLLAAAGKAQRAVSFFRGEKDEDGEEE